uniref:Uncharacterized protein n=1 Tax=Varanus komodoensis TaxID=61221 RepID=A0A8D2L974_VARKO
WCLLVFPSSSPCQGEDAQTPCTITVVPNYVILILSVLIDSLFDEMTVKQGATSVVYDCEDKKTHIKYAAKVLKKTPRGKGNQGTGLGGRLCPKFP